MDKLFKDGIKYYLPTKGITTCVTPIYNEYLHELYKLIFKIFDKYGLEYYVFAGSAIGYVRDKKNIPWADDYDIIVFEKEIDKIEKIIIPALNEHGFNVGCPHWYQPQIYCYLVGWQICRTEHNPANTSFFALDIFLTKVDDKKCIRNMGTFGNYTNKNIPIDYVVPKQYVHFDGLYLPFFNKIEEYVKLEYGDVFNNIHIHMNHTANGVFFNKHWSLVYDDFNRIKNEAIKNTNDRIFKNKYYIGEKKLTITNDIDQNSLYPDEFSILEYININNIGEVDIYNENFLKYCFTIKYYYNTIKISYYMRHDKNIEKKNLFELNFVDVIYLNPSESTFCVDDLIYLHKPEIKYC